jgi:5-methylcytosine-specific restriction enzyme A
MPFRGPRVCGCGKLIAAGIMCPCEHDRMLERKARHDANRPSACACGYDSKWSRESKAFLALPENTHCACGCGRAADMVDHIKPHRGDMKLFWDRKNWQPLASSPCHNSRKQSLEKAKP